MNRIKDFLDNNKPTRMYKIIKKYSIGLGRYSLEIRILKDD